MTNSRLIDLTGNFKRKVLEVVLHFQERNLSKLEKVHVFQKKNASNELNIFFLKNKKKNKKKRRGFFAINL